MKANQNNAEWVSVTYEQQSADTDWVEWQGEIITVPEDLGYSQVDSTASLLYFDGWNDYSGETLFIDIGNGIQQEVMPAGSLSFDINTASYDNVKFDISGQDNASTGLAFSKDGTKMFMAGYAGDSVYQYTLATAFDLSTASYDAVSFSVGGQDSQPYGIAFNSDGTKMFVLGASTDTIYQYTLTTGFDISTASYDSVSLSIAFQDNAPTGLAFSKDGTKMFMVGDATDSVHQYSLSTPWNLSTASYDSVSLNVNLRDNEPNDIAFNPDGTKIFVLGYDSQKIYQYSLTTGFDLNTASYNGVTFAVNYDGIYSKNRGIVFSLNADKLFTVGMNENFVYQYTTNFSSTYSVSLASTPTLVTSIPSVSQHVCLATTDATAFVTDKEFPAVSATTTSITLDYDNNADSVVAVNDTIKIKNAMSNLLVSGMVSTGNITISSGPFKKITMKPDGTKMYVNDDAVDALRQFSLSVPWDVSTAVDTGLSIPTSNTNDTGCAFSPDGTIMWMADISENVVRYNLSTPWEVTSATEVSSTYMGSQTTNPLRVVFIDSGNILMLPSASSCDFYSLSVPWDETTATFTRSFNWYGIDDNILDGFMSEDGTSLFFVGRQNAKLYQYKLTTPYDSTTAVDNSFHSQSDLGSIYVSVDGYDGYVVYCEVNSDDFFSYYLGDLANNVSVSDIVVTTGQTALSFTAQANAPISAILPSWATTYTPISYTESNGNIVQRSDRFLTNNGKRFAKFKLVGDTGQEVSNAKINLWKGV